MGRIAGDLSGNDLRLRAGIVVMVAVKPEGVLQPAPSVKSKK
jgi:hypothetical protein